MANAVSGPNPPFTTSPCPGCGRPVAVGSALCTQCGQQVSKEEQLTTKIGRPERGLAPIPAIAPGPARFRKTPDDALARREAMKPFIVLIVALLAVMAWKGGLYGPGEVANYLIRYAITLGGAVLILGLGALTIIEVGTSAIMAVVGIAAALAGADLLQHALHYLYLGILPWVAAFIAVFLMLAEFLDLEFPDAAYLAIAIIFMKVALSMTLFTAMFPAIEGIQR
jgi:hypothetical protein